jgi:hypothetical protein
MTERFWDEMAPYGANGYSFGRGEWVDGSVSQSVQFKMRPGDQCIARGVMLMSDGRVYTWTVLAEGREHRPGAPRRLASLSRQTFADAARGMLTFEWDLIDPDLIDGYQSQVDAL